MLPWQPFLAFYIWGAHWRHLKNRIEPSMCGGDAALCQITLTTCFLPYSFVREAFVIIKVRCTQYWHWLWQRATNWPTHNNLTTVGVTMIVNYWTHTLLKCISVTHNENKYCSGYGMWCINSYCQKIVSVKLTCKADRRLGCDFWTDLSPGVWQDWHHGLLVNCSSNCSLLLQRPLHSSGAAPGMWGYGCSCFWPEKRRV